MKRFKHNGILCCPQEEIEKELNINFKVFSRWMEGHTVIKSKGKTFFYRQDCEKWTVLKKDNEHIHRCMENIRGCSLDAED